MNNNNDNNASDSNNNSRRNLLVRSISAAVITIARSAPGTIVLPALADDEQPPPATADTAAAITNTIYIDLKAPTDTEASRLLIGLYGKVAPSSTTKIMQLVNFGVSGGGLQAPCKPRDASRILQKEQLEANKVYNACTESERKGVTYEYGTVWRIIQNVGINIGSVSGKFIAREFPNWTEDQDNRASPTSLPIEFGSVSVTRGNESGFGFTIHTNPAPLSNTDDSSTVIVIGKVLPESMPLLERLNATPVVTSSKVGGNAASELRAAPSRSCAYGKKDFYCNEFKPLQKLSIVSTGVSFR